MGRSTKAATRREEQVNMDTETRKDLIHDLDMKHLRNKSESDLLVKDEDVRRLKLRILMLRDENTTLRDQIQQNGDTNARLVAQCDDFSAQLEAKIEVVRSQEAQLRKQEREFTNLKAELQSMNNVSQDSTNLLAEKLTLGRELAILKPELDHLRSQLTHQQTTLAEKLALERQVNTLEVELANEKKATKRAMQKRESNDRVEDELRKKLREAEKQLTAEKTQRERLEDRLAQEKQTHQLALQDQDSTRELESDLRKKLQEATRQLREANEEKERLEEELQAEKRQAKKATKKQSNTEADDELRAKLEEAEKKIAAEQKTREKLQTEAQNDIAEVTRRADAFEKKFEKLKTKYREMQEQLKQCQADLRQAQQTPMQLSLPGDGTKKTAGSQVFRKRKAREITADDITNITIETPGAGSRPSRGTKKRSFEPTLVGEKSMFSVTPFLNKTKDTDEDTTRPDADDGEVEDSILGGQTTRTIEVTTTTVPIAGDDENTTSSSSSAESSMTGPVEPEKPKPQLKTRGRPKKVLGDASSAKKNALPKTTRKKTPKLSNTLEKVTEEGEENAAPEPTTDKTQTVKFNFTLPEDTSTSSANTSKGEEPKKKKRKVLGSTKTLFDDEEEAEAPARKPGKKTQTGGAKRTALAGPQNAFAGAKTFSPLKRDRRGVGASFLA